MATRRRNRERGFMPDSSEKLRQAMTEPVQAWEKQWVTPSAFDADEDTGAQIPYRTYKWVKVSRKVVYDDEEPGQSESEAEGNATPLTTDNPNNEQSEAGEAFTAKDDLGTEVGDEDKSTTKEAVDVEPTGEQGAQVKVDAERMDNQNIAEVVETPPPTVPTDNPATSSSSNGSSNSNGGGETQ
ncbi:hypothetical protein EV182_002687, partial [Spiromyces aspiralis]